MKLGIGRRLSQLSLRAALATTAVACLALAAPANRAWQQQQIVAHVRQVGGKVECRSIEGWRGMLAGWCRLLLGANWAEDPDSVDVSDDRVDDALLGEIGQLTGLRYIWIRSDQISDSGVERLRPLKQLENLALASPRITNRSLETINKLPKLQSLVLSRTQITNAWHRLLMESPSLKTAQLDANSGIVVNGTYTLRPPQQTPRCGCCVCIGRMSSLQAMIEVVDNDRADEDLINHEELENPSNEFLP